MVVSVYDFVVSSVGAHYMSQFIPSSCIWFDFLKSVSCEDQLTGNLTELCTNNVIHDWLLCCIVV